MSVNTFLLQQAFYRSRCCFDFSLNGEKFQVVFVFVSVLVIDVQQKVDQILNQGRALTAPSCQRYFLSFCNSLFLFPKTPAIVCFHRRASVRWTKFQIGPTPPNCQFSTCHLNCYLNPDENEVVICRRPHDSKYETQIIKHVLKGLKLKLKAALQSHVTSLDATRRARSPRGFFTVNTSVWRKELLELKQAKNLCHIPISNSVSKHHGCWQTRYSGELAGLRETPSRIDSNEREMTQTAEPWKLSSTCQNSSNAFWNSFQHQHHQSFTGDYKLLSSAHTHAQYSPD